LDSELQTVPDLAPSPPRPRRRSTVAYDVAIAVALFVFALWVRRSVPHDGLFWDDAWQAFGSTKASLGQLFIAGQTQPGFTVLITVWSQVFGTAASTLVLPAKIAGALGPVALYFVLRWFRYSRSVALLMATILAVCPAHVFHSTRVKSYSADVIVVLLLAIIVDRLCNRTWDVRIAIGWIVIALVAAAMTAIGPLVVVAAGLIIVLHPRSDLRQRIIAVGVQMAAIALYVVAIQRTLNIGAEQDYWKFGRGFITFSANPVDFSQEIMRRLVRVTEAFPGGPHPWPTIAVIVVVVGIARACWRGRRAIASRFLVLAAVLAMAASVAKKVPFAPLGSGIDNTRVMLWLIPLIAFGIAEVLQRVRDLAARRDLERHVFDGIVAVAAIGVALTAISPPPSYPDGGATATRYVMANLEPHDVVWITQTYPFAVAADTPVRLETATHDLVGFRPKFADPRLVLVLYLNPKQLQASIAHASRVWLPLDAVNYNYPPLRAAYETPLARAGFVRSGLTHLHDTFVERWDRKT
jgi:hypothetical protein